MSGAGPPRASIDTNPEQRPDPTPHQRGPPTDAQQPALVTAAGPAGGKKKRARRGRKKSERKRKQSFAATDDDDYQVRNAAHESFSRLKERNGSHDSQDTNPLDNTDLLMDHRVQPALRPRRASTLQPNAFGQSTYDGSQSGRPSYSNPFSPREGPPRRGNSHHASLENLDEDADERTPMLSGSKPKAPGFLNQGSRSNTNIFRKNSSASGGSRHKPTIFDRDPVAYNTPQPTSYNVNYPPSVPGSPRLSSSQGRAISFHDVLAREEYSPERHSEDGLGSPRNGETLHDHSLHGSSHRSAGFERRPTIAARAEEDVCFPAETLSEMGDGGDEADVQSRQGDENAFGKRQPRRRRGRWPDLRVLEEWSVIEKEGRSEEQRRAKRMVEPQLIGGRLRPTHQRNWHRVEEDAPYRFTYFNEDFPSTIHSQSISELVQPEGSFRELFIPDPPQLSDSSSDEEDDDAPPETAFMRHSNTGTNGDSRAPTRQTTREGSVFEEQKHYATPAIPPIDRDNSNGKAPSRTPTPHGEKQSTSSNMDGAAHSLNIPIPENGTNRDNSSGQQSPKTRDRPARYGDRPTWWLDVLSPTDSEMKVLSKAFGIHPLTAEDIMMQEAREKVELFRNYYFVNYRTFEQDMSNEDFLEPVNMYIIVFREGVISFHFSLTPHPANVRRRIRQLKDYLILSSDWISYAMIDDITDVFAPLIQNIEDEVDDIDDSILMLHSSENEQSGPFDEKKSDTGKDAIESGGDMLRRVGDCRKKVMGLYRLLGNKADVIKGFAKRCNEHWEVAPRSEIGLYLGDIQDHIVTMTGNLSHYEKILARSHGNYLAQINIRMNERQEQTADVLGKLTVLGTIVLPMNIITGLWGMNVWVPGQDSEGNLTWFWCITGGLLFFGLACYFIAKTLYKIV